MPSPRQVSIAVIGMFHFSPALSQLTLPPKFSIEDQTIITNTTPRRWRRRKALPNPTRPTRLNPLPQPLNPHLPLPHPPQHIQKINPRRRLQSHLELGIRAASQHHRAAAPPSTSRIPRQGPRKSRPGRQHVEPRCCRHVSHVPAEGHIHRDA